MKRFNHLWEQTISFENLYQASRLAQKGKRFNTSTLVFNDSARKRAQPTARRTDQQNLSTRRISHFPDL